MHTSSDNIIYIYVHTCSVCVSVRVCIGGGKRGRGKGDGREGREGVWAFGLWWCFYYYVVASKYFFSFPAELGTFSRTIHNNQSRYSIL